jgi:hypothetical protein
MNRRLLLWYPLAIGFLVGFSAYLLTVLYVAFTADESSENSRGAAWVFLAMYAFPAALGLQAITTGAVSLFNWMRFRNQ